MRRILNLISIVGLLLAALGATSVPFVFADCVGTSGDDSLECTSTSPDYSADMVVDGGEGEDTITVSDADVNDVNGGEGDDSITVSSDGEAEDVRGDQDFWGGDDTIVVDDDIDGEVEGDSAVFCYDWENDQAESCNDTIVLNGSADAVVGDDVFLCLEGDCNDDITVNGEADVVVGDYTDICGTESCNDDITINGGTLAVIGDQTGYCGDDSCNDTINVNGVGYVVIGDNVDVEGIPTLGVDGVDSFGYGGTPAGDDTINVGAEGDSYLIVGDNITATDYSCSFGGSSAQAGNDTITVDGAVGEGFVGAVIGDNITLTGGGCYFSSVEDAGFGGSSSGGNDTITINGLVNGAVIGDSVNITDYTEELFGFGGSSSSGNDTIVVNGEVNGYVIGDSVNVDIGDYDPLSFGGSSSSGNDTIVVNGEVNGDVIGDSVNIDLNAPLDVAFGGSSNRGNDTIEINGLVDGSVIGDSGEVYVGIYTFGSSSSGNDNITINGTVTGDVFGDGAFAFYGDVPLLDESFGGFGATENDVITVTGTVEGSIYADSGKGPALIGATEGIAVGNDNNDTVILSAGGVQYVKKCGDITQAVVGSNTPTATIGGIIDGGWEDSADTLFIGLTTANADEIAALQAQLNSGSGTVTVGDKTYSWTDFENVQVQGTVYSEGATQLFDNGVVTTYMGGDGKSIDICYDPEGFGYKVSLVNFDDLDKGIREFSLGKEGFTAIVNNDTSTCDPKYTPANANWKVELYHNGVMVDNHFCFIH